MNITLINVKFYTYVVNDELKGQQVVMIIHLFIYLMRKLYKRAMNTFNI